MTLKEIARHFLELSSKGNSREAFSEYVGPGFKHHNAWYKGDADTLMLAMEENAKQMPGKVFEIQRALEDGNLAAVHSKVIPTPGGPAAAVTHIFRFENGKIVELWDMGMGVPEDIVNENGMF